jgi:hypothetical protein
VGLRLRLLTDDTVRTIPATSIGINNPSQMSDGDCSLSIVTRFSGGDRTLKQPRTLTLEYSLTVDTMKPRQLMHGRLRQVY